MGTYLNPGAAGFAMSLRSQIYVDKTEMIAYTNSVLQTQQRFICVSRPRRFGKSMTADMLAAYYSRGCESQDLFQGLEIAADPSFTENLNRFNVIAVNMQDFLSVTDSVPDMISRFEYELLKELKDFYPACAELEETRLMPALNQIFSRTQEGFIFIVDEWDCIFRERKTEVDAQSVYLDFLRTLWKDKPYALLVYMTGILPIKKYGTHSALNMFDEFSMTDPKRLAKYVGFTENEVLALCRRYDMDFSETKRWYNGYRFRHASNIYSPKSVVDAMRNGDFGSYWTQTETYEALRIYIDMNFDGLKDSIIQMLGGGRCKINPVGFGNDMQSFQKKDDVLTLLVHLGYLAYDICLSEVFIPNEEVRGEFLTAIEFSDWHEVIDAVSASEILLEDTLSGNEKAVADGLERVHMETTSILSYNDENALSSVISLAYYSARNYYTLVRELPSGKGFADIVFLPRKTHPEKPALIVELKWNQSAEGAIQQIREKQYVQALSEYTGRILLVGINYDKSTKKHQCVIEMMG